MFSSRNEKFTTLPNSKVQVEVAHTPKHTEQEWFQNLSVQLLADAGSVPATPNHPVVTLTTRTSQNLLGPIMLGTV